MDRHQASQTVLMIRPAAFGFNPETAETNAFQRPDPGVGPEQVHQRALGEFDGLAAALGNAGVDVIVVQDTRDPQTPDAVFPNNWVSFHEDGEVFLYPMLAASRRREVRRDILDELAQQHGFRIGEVVDLTAHEDDAQFLEGTGSLVLDRVHAVAYAVLSARTHPAALDAFCKKAGYEGMRFHALDSHGQAIYHTNVVMCVGRSFAVICADAIADAAEREAVLARLAAGGREIVLIDLPQMESFAGNMLELRDRDGNRVLAASARAAASLRADQSEALARHARMVVADLRTIEDYGGGSARCMLAEVFLPRA